MPVMKIHISNAEKPAVKPMLAKRLFEVMVESLKPSNEKAQVLLYDTAPQYRAVYPGEGSSFVFIEILLESGAATETKESLANGLIEETTKILSCGVEDIKICIIESPLNNWYGGLSK